ncbi:hypothetical protein [Patulibacter defluvii]|uniref:hypothetical protein n=1 Tax=Patulibacter defluvii TaxID=3095358 RepID=UPI002A74802F|nr:hypothetical protein [Patulibacter sp. DM4]
MSGRAARARRSSGGRAAEPQADLVREQRVGRIAGVAGMVGVAGTVAALLVAARSSAGGSGSSAIDRARQLRDFHADVSGQALALGLRVLALVATIALALFLARAVIDRGGRDGTALRVLAVAGPLALVAALVVGFVAIRDVADAYAAGAPSPDRADRLWDDSGLLRATGIGEIAAHLVFGVWLIWLSLRAMAVGLLTRVLGYWGIAAGVVGVVLPLGDTLFMGWLASVALLAWGWWPGGLPLAWTTGRAVPWDIPIESGAAAR